MAAIRRLEILYCPVPSRMSLPKVLSALVTAAGCVVLMRKLYAGIAIWVVLVALMFSGLPTPVQAADTVCHYKYEQTTSPNPRIIWVCSNGYFDIWYYYDPDYHICSGNGAVVRGSTVLFPFTKCTSGGMLFTKGYISGAGSVCGSLTVFVLGINGKHLTAKFTGCSAPLPGP